MFTYLEEGKCKEYSALLLLKEAPGRGHFRGGVSLKGGKREIGCPIWFARDGELVSPKQPQCSGKGFRKPARVWDLVGHWVEGKHCWS